MSTSTSYQTPSTINCLKCQLHLSTQRRRIPSFEHSEKENTWETLGLWRRQTVHFLCNKLFMHLMHNVNSLPKIYSRTSDALICWSLKAGHNTWALHIYKAYIHGWFYTHPTNPNKIGAKIILCCRPAGSEIKPCVVVTSQEPPSPESLLASSKSLVFRPIYPLGWRRNPPVWSDTVTRTRLAAESREISDLWDNTFLTSNCFGNKL